MTLGALLLAFGAYRVLHDAKPVAKVEAPPPVARLLVATRDVARGETLSAGDITTLPIQGAPPLGAMTAPGEAVGRVAVNDIAARRLILVSDVSADTGAAGLSFLIKPGYRAITLDANDEIAVGSFLRPGDRVDVQAVLPAQGRGGLGQSRAWLTDIEVLAVGGVTGAGAPSSTAPAGQAPARTVTLAMTPDQVSRFVLARSAGRVYLSLRNPSDRLPAAAEASPPRRAAPVRAAAARTTGPIEMIVEGRREVLYPGADQP